MDIEQLLEASPFVELLGIEFVEVESGHAVGTLSLTEELIGIPGANAVHGGVIPSLADTVGGMAIASRTKEPTPTIDLRIDYLAPATNDLTAEAELLRIGDTVGVADIKVVDSKDTLVARGRGIFKTGGQNTDSPWSPTSE